MKLPITEDLKTILFASSSSDVICDKMNAFFKQNIGATIIDSYYSSNNSYFSVFIYYKD